MTVNYAILTEDKKVQPVPLQEWAAFLEQKNPSNRVIKQEDVNGVYISTVFLGLNHGFGGHDKWFETMVFARDREPTEDEYQKRYETYDEAIAGHELTKKMVEKGEL